jgi:hypothetical protein
VKIRRNERITFILAYSIFFLVLLVFYGSCLATGWCKAWLCLLFWCNKLHLQVPMLSNFIDTSFDYSCFTIFYLGGQIEWIAGPLSVAQWLERCGQPNLQSDIKGKLLDTSYFGEHNYHCYCSILRSLWFCDGKILILI